MAGRPPRPCFPGFCATDRLRGGFSNQSGRLARIGTQSRALGNCRSVIFAGASHRSNHHPWSRGRNDARPRRPCRILNAIQCGGLATWQASAGAWLLGPADRTILLPSYFWPPTLPKTYSRASAVLFDELDAGSFQSTAHGQIVGRGH